MKKILQVAQDYAKSHNGSLITTEYVNAKTNMEWKCQNENHLSWLATWDNIQRHKSWCPECRLDKIRKENGLTFLKKAQEYAKSHNGSLITTEYVNAKTKMEWKCSNPEHSPFFLDLDKAKSKNRWCKSCAIHSPEWTNNRQKAIDIAKSHGGLVIFPKDIEHIKTNTLLTFKCSNHEHKPWQTIFRNISEFKAWCPECAGRFTPEEFVKNAHKFAKDNGGLCLTNIYENQNSRFKFKCSVSEHDEFEGSYKMIKNNVWCKECKKTSESVLSYKASRLQEAKEFAKTRGGECLSTEFISTESYLIWKCHEQNHKSWKSKFNNTVGKNQRWCPECSNKSYKEDYSRYILEQLLGFNLQKANPKWNINPLTKRCLELDGYNQQHKFAFEFQGQQHFKIIPFWIKKNEELIKIQERDKQKKINCKLNDVFLLEIIDNNLNYDNLASYIRDLLEIHNISYNKNIDLEKLKIEAIFKINSSKQKNFLKLAQDYAISKNGKCLSPIYINAKTNLEWKCQNENHPSWFAPISIASSKNKRWCWKCYIKAA